MTVLAPQGPTLVWVNHGVSAEDRGRSPALAGRSPWLHTSNSAEAIQAHIRLQQQAIELAGLQETVKSVPDAMDKEAWKRYYYLYAILEGKDSSYAQDFSDYAIHRGELISAEDILFKYETKKKHFRLNPQTAKYSIENIEAVILRESRERFLANFPNVVILRSGVYDTRAMSAWHLIQGGSTSNSSKPSKDQSHLRIASDQSPDLEAGMRLGFLSDTELQELEDLKTLMAEAPNSLRLEDLRSLVRYSLINAGHSRAEVHRMLRDANTNERCFLIVLLTRASL